MTAKIIPLPMHDPEEAWERFAAYARRAHDDPSLAENREFMAEAALRHSIFVASWEAALKRAEAAEQAQAGGAA